MTKKTTNIGLEKKEIEQSVRVLINYLADSYYLYLKTHQFHWNVTGPNFYSLHKMFEEQYNALFLSIDDIAERIRALGAFVPSPSAELKQFTSLEDVTDVPSAAEMLSLLLADHETVIRNIRTWLKEELDPSTDDFLIGRMEEHEKTAWMLRASQ